MKKLTVDPAKCTGCGICETECSKAFYKDDNREKSAIRISAGDGSYSIDVCDQCGDCMGMCSVMALRRDKNGVVQLNKKECVGCLICVGECLRNYFYYNNELPTPFKCIACGICTKKCPGGAIKIESRQ